MFDDAKKNGRRKTFASIEDLFKGAFDDADVDADTDEEDEVPKLYNFFLFFPDGATK
jgi:hypothetical protein